MKNQIEMVLFLLEGDEKHMNYISLPIKKIVRDSGKRSESLQSLRVNIEFCGVENRILAVTSCIPGEGKSTVSLQLAAKLAEVGKCVLFIDADMRQSVLSDKIGIQERQKIGLAEVLAGKETLDSTVYRCDIDGLSVLLAGKRPPNPTQLLSQTVFRALLDEARESYDYVILDTPPVGSVIDGAVIGQSCDGVIMVIGSNMISERIASKAILQLQRANCKILGAVLNKVRLSNRALYGTYGTSKYYYSSYTSYYGDGSGHEQ